ncbi:spore germination protein [Metabacillus idriensis]|uniref:GerAB/ArcD/ProY family transporter n=1 Tax=Metabacillus idriensis TaxID=324768 RepID=A0A6I2MHQ9_9BACI|nr:spore germination protein [Metabacillus idriensis]MCM3596013.1 spore germination protein [Metabacillus idriensis]MRX56667.1 GerAB/ArcD/ProY family transporter [Metabacillus idriensis]OHR73833.1 spore gernimation protein [Bacillus sp. HMSC76G11]
MSQRPIDQITTPQAVVMITNFILGIGILTLPRTVTEKVKTPDGWITIILGGIIVMIMAIIIVKLAQRHPGKSIYQFSQDIAGKWIGSVLGLCIILYYLTLSSFEIRAMAETTRLFLLQGTPIWAIIMPFIWIGIYLIVGGINPIARMFELIFPVTVLFFILVMFLGFKIFEIDNLRPVLGMGMMPSMKGLATTSLSFIGFEVIMILLMFMKKPEHAVKATLIGIIFPLLFYVITFVMVVGSLSTDGVVTQTWPVLTFIRSFEYPGLFVERFDSLLLVIWIMQLFATFTVSYFAAAIGLSQLLNKKMKTVIFGLAPFIFIFSMIPKNSNEMFQMGSLLGNFALYFFSAVPILLLFGSIVKGKKHEKT